MTTPIAKLLDLTKEEAGWLEEGLGELMTDGYGQENSEGCWEPDVWERLEKLSLKVCRFNVNFNK